MRKKGDREEGEGGASSVLCFFSFLMSGESGFNKMLLIYMDNVTLGKLQWVLVVNSVLCLCKSMYT